ncbi:RDD family protein [Streptomyces sp. SID13726]|uniref:RDD family protein n=1 Tax=Streptomyces sp. SID13726 TaxID=2706058 RepID=UPI0013B99002|nr:RDD family protein [Streptomyces sp. SID13726]NEB04856.1 DUF2510 domain-containing protein [Streptomyces sp. SID13726]
MSAPTPAPGDDRPREGYYPDPSIPGYVRYWNGASWVPGTSRPAPADGEPLVPPPGPGSAQSQAQAQGPAASPVEETGPHFFDEDPVAGPGHPEAQHGNRPEPAAAWTADRARQSGFGGDQDRRVSWGAPEGNGPAQGAGHGVPQQGAPQGADPRVAGAAPAQPAGQAARTDGSATIPPVEPDEDGGTRVFRRPTAGAAQQPGDDGTMKFRALSPRTAQQNEGPGAQSGSTPGPAYSGPTAQGGGQGGGAPLPGAVAGGAGGHGGAGVPGGPGAPGGAGAQSAVAPAGPQGPGFGAGKAAAERAAATGAAGPQGPASGAATALSGSQQSAPAAGPQTAPPGVPQQGQPQGAGQPGVVAQGLPQQSGPQLSSTPMSTGHGGGQPSWAQQVHRLAGPDEEQPAPWKPPVEDIFQAAARRQAAARPASLGKRLAARLLDTLVVGAVTAVAAVPLGAEAADHISAKIDEAKLSGETVTVWLLDGTTSVYLAIVVAVLLVAGTLYEALPTAKWGRTLGKKLLGLEVRDIEGHEPPAFGAALRRWLVYSVPGLLGIGLVGVAWCLFDKPWHQCWHDKAAHTFVAG